MKRKVTFKNFFYVFRGIIAALLIVHGVTRYYDQTIPDFGGFLSSKGFPLGVPLAYFITAMEIFGGGLVVMGKFVKWITPFFIIELFMGIVMVHWNYGFFVVGHGNNGFEYSLLLIASFLLILLEEIYKPFKQPIYSI